MRRTSSAGRRKPRIGRVVVVKTDTGWTIRYLESDLESRYAPVPERNVERAIKGAKANEEVEI